MTRLVDYLEDATGWKEGAELLSVMRTILRKMDELGDEWHKIGQKFLFEVIEKLSTRSKTEWLSDAVFKSVLEDLPPDTTATYLMEVVHLSVSRSKKGSMIKPLELLLEPIFTVDFPQIYGSILTNLLVEMEKGDSTVIKEVTFEIGDQIPALVR